MMRNISTLLKSTLFSFVASLVLSTIVRLYYTGSSISSDCIAPEPGLKLLLQMSTGWNARRNPVVFGTGSK